MKCYHKASTLKNWSNFAIYNTVFTRLHSLFKVLSQIHKFVSCKFHVTCILIANFVPMIMNPKQFFFLLNETYKFPE